MRLLACTALALVTAACAAGAPPPVVERASLPEPPAFTPDPQEDAIPASGAPYTPIANPPAPRPNSEIERMTPRELVAWVAPDRTGVWHAQANRGRMGDHVGVVLFEEPRPTR